MTTILDHAWFRAVLRLVGGRVEWEVQRKDPQGCYRTWSNGFSTYRQANDYVHVERFRYRIQGQVIFTRYYNEDPP